MHEYEHVYTKYLQCFFQWRGNYIAKKELKTLLKKVVNAENL